MAIEDLKSFEKDLDRARAELGVLTRRVGHIGTTTQQTVIRLPTAK